MAADHDPHGFNHLIKIAVLEAELDSLRDAIKLQAQEYERRLTELNHAHSRATDDRNKFVTTDLFYSKQDELSKWRSELDQWRSRIIGIAIGVSAMTGAVVGLMMRLFK